jgi:uncharacterized coiled-coil protein SlyX
MTIADWIALAAGVAGIVAPLVGFVYGTLKARIADAERQCAKLSDDLAAYKLTVAKEYASVDHLQEVERRITDGFKELKADLKAGLDALARQLAEVRK